MTIREELNIQLKRRTSAYLYWTVVAMFGFLLVILSGDNSVGVLMGLGLLAAWVVGAVVIYVGFPARARSACCGKSWVLVSGLSLAMQVPPELLFCPFCGASLDDELPEGVPHSAL